MAKRPLALLILLMAPAAWAQVNVFACEPEWGALAEEIGGAKISVYNATTGLQDPHRVQARPSLIAAYRRADLLICTGAGLETGWLPTLARKGNNPGLKPGSPGYLEVSALVEMLEIPAVVDRALGDVHPYGNPHVQTDPNNYRPVAQALSDRLSAIDPAHADHYRERRDAFLLRWNAAIEGWAVQAAPLQGVPVISSHQGFVYLYRWLKLEEVAVLEDKPGLPPSAGHLQSVLLGLDKQPARMVIHAAYQSDRPARWMAERSGMPTVKLPFTIGGSAGATDLYRLFDITIERLLAGLNT